MNPELLAELKAIHNEKWKELTVGMVFSEVVIVANRLKELSAGFSNEELNEYAISLEDAVEAFDQAEIERLLTRFSDFIKEAN